MHISLASGRPRFVVLRFFALATVATAIVLGLAGLAGAASPAFTDPGTLTSVPGSSVAVPYSTADQPAYVKYEVTYARDPSDTSSLTHTAITEPATPDPLTGNPVDQSFPDGAAIVSVTGCPSVSYRGANQGITCSFGTLRPGATIDLTIVVKTPPNGAGAPASLFNQAILTFKEGANDSQPQSGFQDTFASNAVTTRLTGDTSSALNSYTNPTSTTVQSFSTDKNLCVGSSCSQSNPQWTQASIKGGVGVQVGLSENNFGTGNSCPTVAATLGLNCFGQLSTITVGSSGAGGPFACTATNLADANCLQFTVFVAGASLTFPVNVKKIVILHAGVPVPFCSTGTTDTGTTAGDCVVSIVQDSKTKNITWVARGPSNGGWGGIA